MKVYINLKDNFNSSVESISTSYGQYEVEQDNITIDFTKLSGYYLVLDESTNTYRLLFDEGRYDNVIAEQKREQSINEGQKVFNDLANSLILNNATDEQAYIMRYLYHTWKADVDYKTNDRFMYEDKFYKVLQDHTSQEDWLPTTATSLYVEITDPSIEYPEFKQPTSSVDAYNKGDKVTFEGKKYISLINANTYSPVDYPDGWQIVSE